LNDGSLFENAPSYPNMMREIFARYLMGQHHKIELKLVKDGSGIGAALTSAAIAAAS
jgi:hexokinase